jgi:hypothetical protein
MLNKIATDLVHLPVTKTTLDITLNAQVDCADGPGGRCAYVIVNRLTRCVTQLVIKANDARQTEYLVPLKLVVETSPCSIRLRCNQGDLTRLSPFIETFWVKADPYYSIGLLAEESPCCSDFFLVKHFRISVAEVAIHRNTRVEAANGRVGWVERIIANSGDGCISRLVLKTGYLYGKKTVTVRAAEIDRITKDAVRLKLDKTGFAALPATPVRRQ